MTSPNPFIEADLMMTRRQLFGRSALGLGTLALSDLLGAGSLTASDTPLPMQGTHHRA
ncbi:MAG: sulfatase, partial [Verrucomicrobia bacterium]|nr:sulfatase [Verrucomicrobiota bacterium]